MPPRSDSRPGGRFLLHLNAFLSNLAIVLGVAAVTTVVFQRLRQPVIFGYMLAGLLIGPHIPIPLVADRAVVDALAELGVVLLMFSLGLEFTFRRLLQVGPAGALVALAQSSLMLGIGFSVGRMFGWSVFESVLAGGMIAISSTMVIVKAFREQGVRGPAADLVFGVLIVQDLLAILLLAILTPIAAGHALSPGALLATVLRFLGFLAAAISLGVLILPRLMRHVVGLRRPETTVVASVGICFGGALLAQQLGYSIALGAFLAGALVAESGEAAAIERLVEPIRDLFVAVFFVAIGMLVDPQLVGKHALPIGVLTALVLVGDIMVVSIGAFLTGNSLQTSVRAAMSLAQIGEFSFIIAGLGVATGAGGAFLSTIAVTISALTTLLTPWLIRYAPRAAAHLDRHLPRTLQNFVGLYGSWLESLRRSPELPVETARARRAIRLLLLDVTLLAALVVGARIEGGAVSEWLRARAGLSVETARVLLISGVVALAAPFAFGCVRTSATLGRALAARAFPLPEPGRLDPAAAPRRAMVMTIQLSAVAGVGVLLAAVTQPVLPGLTGFAVLGLLLVVPGVRFWRDAANLSGHTRAGAQVIVAALTRHTASPGDSAGDALGRAYQLVPGLGSPVPLKLDARHPAVGRTIGELELRGRTGATILAIVRGENVVLVPDGHERLAPNDVLALAGTGDSVESALRLLTGAPDPAADPAPG